MKPLVVKLQATASGFTDDKDEAKKIRVGTLLPSLNQDKHIVLDFGDVTSSTQSFVHALLGEGLQKHKEVALDRIEFAHCNPLMKSLIELVVDYSLGGFKTDIEETSDQPPSRAVPIKKRRH